MMIRTFAMVLFANTVLYLRFVPPKSIDELPQSSREDVRRNETKESDLNEVKASLPWAVSGNRSPSAIEASLPVRTVSWTRRIAKPRPLAARGPRCSESRRSTREWRESGRTRMARRDGWDGCGRCRSGPCLSSVRRHPRAASRYDRRCNGGLDFPSRCSSHGGLRSRVSVHRRGQVGSRNIPRGTLRSHALGSLQSRPPGAESWFLPIPLTQVALSTIREHEDDTSSFDSLRQPEPGVERRAARGADQETLLPREATHGPLRILRGHGEDFVGERGIPDAWHMGTFEALHALDSMERAVRLDADQADAGILLFEVPTCTDERPGRPQARDEGGNRPARLPPNLRAGRREMGPPVRLVVVRIQVPGFLRVVH